MKSILIRVCIALQLSIFRISCCGCFDHNGALHTFSLQLAPDIICIVDGAVEIVGVSRAAAAAVKFCKAVLTFFFGIYIAALKFVPQIRILNPVENTSHKELLFSYKLMAGVEISPRGYRQIFRAGAAA